MKVLEWVGDHPILTVILLSIIFSGIHDIVRTVAR
jgi:hypothetical protein